MRQWAPVKGRGPTPNDRAADKQKLTPIADRVIYHVMRRMAENRARVRMSQGSV